MKKLYDYEHLRNDTFYRCIHILNYIENNRDLSELDREAIQNTIMDSLVYFGDIDPTTCSLDLDNMCIRNDINHFIYQEYPNISGIPQFMKERFRTKALHITGQIPISMFLAKPSSKLVRYCVYDPNTAVSSVFSYFKFYNVKYLSPTRGVYLEEDRPFVEVPISDEMYLVDVLTKRIIKSSFFKKNYGFDISFEIDSRTMDEKQRKIYLEQIADATNFGASLSMLSFFNDMFSNSSSFAEYIYELEKSKEYFPLEWERYEQLKREEEIFFNEDTLFKKIKKRTYKKEDWNKN